MRYTISLALSPSSELWKTGVHWLGMEPFSGEIIDQPVLLGIDADRLWELTRSARRLGFHAPVKPFFRLACGVDEEQLCGLLNIFSLKHHSFVLSSLTLRAQENKFFLEPDTYPSSLLSLAADCIRTFDPYGAAPKPSESARLKAAVLSPQEKQNLELWGYPYVFNQYRFRLFLTSRITDAAEKEVMYSALARIFVTVSASPLKVDALCLFVEAGSGQPMRFIRRFPLPSHLLEKEEPKTNDNQNVQEFYTRYQRNST